MAKRALFLVWLYHGETGAFAPRFLASAPPLHAAPPTAAERIASSAVGTAAVAAAAVSKAVSMKTLSAPELERSFIALDSAASAAGVVDDQGLPLVYNKELIEKYWEKENGALQARWGEFLRYSVPFLTRCAGLLIKG